MAQLPQYNSSKSDHPFGMLMPGRSYSSTAYKYGFNGKEKDDEVKGAGNSLDFGARVYDSRLGRWLSLDPLMAEYPFATPYNFCLNSSIRFIDPDGKRFANPFDKDVESAKVDLTDAKKIFEQNLQAFKESNNGKATRKDINTLRSSSGLTNAENQLKTFETKKAEVDKYYYTLEKTNRGEYNYFNTLQVDGKDVIISVYVEDENIVSNDVGTTAGFKFDGFKPAAANISITLYNSTKINRESVKNSLTPPKSGRDYSTFCNELGDVKYVYDKVIDFRTYQIWQESGNSKSKYYDTKDTKYAGEYSRQYSIDRTKEAVDYCNQNNENCDEKGIEPSK